MYICWSVSGRHERGKTWRSTLDVIILLNSRLQLPMSPHLGVDQAHCSTKMQGNWNQVLVSVFVCWFVCLYVQSLVQPYTVWSCDQMNWAGKDSKAQRWQKKRQAEEKVGRQHPRMDSLPEWKSLAPKSTKAPLRPYIRDISLLFVAKEEEEEEEEEET